LLNLHLYQPPCKLLIHTPQKKPIKELGLFPNVIKLLLNRQLKGFIMYTSAQVNELIKRQSGQITSQIIKDLIADHRRLRDKTIELFHAYKGRVPIEHRSFEDPAKINNKLKNDYRGDIVDEKIGYIFGNPVKYSLPSDRYPDNMVDELNGFMQRNYIRDLDAITGRFASICGYGARLCYIDTEGKESVMSINPWEVIFVYDQILDKLNYALIYYELECIDASGATKKKTRVEWYDKQNVTYYIQDDSGNYILDASEKVNPQPHLFEYVPVIRYMNNDMLQGDFEKAETLIDAYDRNLSDIQNELEEFRLAYLGFSGDTAPTRETIQQARQTGAFFMPNGNKIEFITKQLDNAVQMIENHKKTLNENIYKFTKAVDMRDEQFSGSAMSGESRKWKLVSMENDAIIKEVKFSKANIEMYRIVCSSWNKRNVKVEYTDIAQQFTRNLPIDLGYLADVQMKFKGNISDETRLSLLPFITNVQEELDKMKAELADTLNPYLEPGNADNTD
jgi:SPP1 family phage portal protein